MDTLSLILLFVAALCAIFALLAMRQSGKHAAAYRDAQGALLEREGERAAALEAASRAERQLEKAQDELRLSSARAEKAERDIAVTRQQMTDQRARMEDFETHQQRMLEAAKAAVLQAGNEVSSKLLADHKQENEAAKKQTGEITAKLFENFHNVTGRVEAMQRSGSDLQGRMDLVMRALTNPTGAGKIAEVGLENLLKNFGFEPGRDFHMQYHIAGDEGSLRPDAVLYLPQNTVVVIDSKASKFVIEFEEARGGESEAEVLEKFKRSMREHAKALAGKNYENAFRESYRKAGRDGEIGTILNLMYFHSEAAIERLRAEDSNLYEYLQKYRILLVGPSTLHSICAFASTRLAESQRAENQHQITEAVSQLMESVTIAIGYAGKMGKGIKTLSEEYAAFVASINGRTLSRMQRLKKLGVTASSGKDVPIPLPIYEVLKREELLEHQAEESSEKIVSLIERSVS